MSFPEHGKVLFSATLVRGHIAKFHIPYLKWFKEQGWETWVAAKNDYPDNVCNIPYCDHFVDVNFARSPFSKRTLEAYRQLRKLFSQERFDIVHTHTPVGGVLTRLAARHVRKAGTKVIYTAHGFHFYKGAPLVNWLLWYPVEKVMSRLTDMLITINYEDFMRAKQFAHCRVEYVPGVGVDLSKFSVDKCREEKRKELGLSSNNFCILMIGDLNANKNHHVLVEALKKLPKNVMLFIAGEGPLQGELSALASRIGVSDRVVFLGFRDDVAALLNASDLFCMPSKREGLPISLIEALATGTPVLVSDARGCADVLDGLNDGLIVSEFNADVWADHILSIIKNGYPVDATELRNKAEVFGIESSIASLAHLYESVCPGKGMA